MMLKKCKNCGAVVRVLKDCTCDDCEINCCNEKMLVIKPNKVEASFEKHIPTYEKIDNNIKVIVNHIMDSDHYIEWICCKTKNSEQIVYFKPGETPEAIFKYEKGSIIYSYCNKHLLWMKEVN